ncbi:MAG: hypothetical protein ACYC3W_02245 [Candidatus Nanopelagicales bacterium]
MQAKIYASCRSPRAEVIQTAEGFRSRVKVTKSGWMESTPYQNAADALTVCRQYIRDASQGRIDPVRALKLISGSASA